MRPASNFLLLTSLLLLSPIVLLLLLSCSSTQNFITEIISSSSDNLISPARNTTIPSHHDVGKSSPRVIPYTPDPGLSAPINSTKRFVILLTSFRGGSTFLGKLFEENPDVQYLFEPLHSGGLALMMRNQDRLSGCTQQHTPREQRILYLKQLIECGEVFPNKLGYVEKYRICGGEEENLRRFEGSECPLDSQVGSDDDRIRLMTSVCESRDTTVVKVIRLSSLRDLLLIRDIRNVDFRVVHLLRHPIGIMNARQGWSRFDYKPYRFWAKVETYPEQELETIRAWQAHVYCSNALETMRLLEAEPWLKERYLLVTHTELGLNPVETSSTIYNHVGLTMPAYLKDFVRDTTTGQAEDRMKNTTNKQGKVFVTSKDSASIISKWKAMDKLKMSGIRTVDTICSKLMSILEEESPFEALDLMSQLQIYSQPELVL